MDSNLVIKVKYRDTLRRFNVGIGDGEQLDLDMAGLREKIIGLFNFPLDTVLTLTYIDEDGDVVTLVDDDDLCDVVRQRLKFLRIDVQLNNDKLGKPYAGSRGSSTPLRPPSVQPPLAGFNTGAHDVLKSVPEPLRNSISEIFSKLSFDVASKAASASPVLSDLVKCLSKIGESHLSPVSQSGAAADSSIPLGSSETPCAPSFTEPDPLMDCGLQSVLPKFTATESSCKASKEANTGNATRGVDVPGILDTAAVDLIVDPPSDANLTGCDTISSGQSTSNTVAHNDKKNTERNNGHNKDKNFSFDTSTAFIDTARKCYPIDKMGRDPSSECSFSSGAPVANNRLVPIFSIHPPGTSKRNFVSSDGNVMFGTFHKGIGCDGCGVLPITGPRFKSKVKDNYDLCSICFSKMGNEADYIRMDRPMHYRHPRYSRTSDDHIPRVGGPALTHVLRNGVLKLAHPRLESRFIMDVNVLDGTVMAPLTPFTKIWRMRNNGTLPWSPGMKLVWIGGVQLRSKVSVDIEIPSDGVPVDGELDISVDFTAPHLSGQYVSYWTMASQSGMKFGQRVWVLIHVDSSLKDTISDSLQGLNLNLPPESSGTRDSEIIDMNVDFVTEPCNSNASIGPVKPMVNEQSSEIVDMNVDFVTEPCNSNACIGPVKPMVNEQTSEEHTVNNSDVPTPVPKPSSAVYPTVDLGVSAPAFPQAPSVSYPIIDLFEAVPAPPSEVPVPATTNVQVSSVEDSGNAAEQTLLKELEDMGFMQIDLNKEILRMNAYDLEKSVDDLCGVSEWDPILDQLLEMGFCDAEMNKKLLKKNNGSIKEVVMDLLTGERA